MEAVRRPSPGRSASTCRPSVSAAFGRRF